jgi:hypothetical protein
LPVGKLKKNVTKKMEQKDLVSESPTYVTLNVSNPTPYYSQVAQLINQFPHIHLTKVHSEAISYLRLSQRSKTNISRQDLVLLRDHILRKPWSTSFVIMEELRLTFADAENKNLKRKRNEEATNDIKKVNRRDNFINMSDEWNKQATEKFWIYKVSPTIGDCPAILLLEKSCIESKPIAGQIVLVRSPNILKRKQDYVNFMSSSLISTELQSNNIDSDRDKKCVSPIGLHVKEKDTIFILGFAANYGICQHVTYGPEYRDKLDYESITPKSDRKSKPKFLGDSIKCYTPVDT